MSSSSTSSDKNKDLIANEVPDFMAGFPVNSKDKEKKNETVSSKSR